MRRFKEIEGLRAYLALWVVIGHIIVYAKLTLPTVLKVFEFADVAVDIFIILSGFVITNLIVEKHENYASYIIRRFFRLWPVFAVCCVAGWLTYDFFVEALIAYHGSGEITQLYTERLAGVREHPWAHVLAHMTMFHGAIPEEILSHADGTFLGTAWSLSLEWQFYLIVPSLLWLSSRRYGWLMVSVLSCLVWGAYTLGYLGTFHRPSILFGAAGYFLLGIVSRVAMPMFKEQHHGNSAATALLAMTFIFVEGSLPLVIWGGFYLCLVSPSPPRIFVTLFANRLVCYLGKRSYSIYLVHLIILGVVMYFVTRYIPDITPVRMSVYLLSAIPATILVAHGLYRFVELPGMGIGRKLALVLCRPNRLLE